MTLRALRALFFGQVAHYSLCIIREAPICIPMWPSQTAGDTETVGDRLVRGWAGRHSRLGNGSWILNSAGPGPAFSRGAGLPITMEDGSSMPLAAAGFIPRRFSTDT